MHSSNNRGGLIFRAGPAAFDLIREHGFSEDLIGTILGASGGAKWLVLSQLDRVILNRVLPKIPHPVHVLGSSIGAWRFACYAQQDPVSAIERFEAAYLEQTYTEKPDAAEITARTVEILDAILGPQGASDIVAHPSIRTSIMTVRARHLVASEYRPILAAGLLLAMSANLVHRRALGAFFERGLFYDAREQPPFFGIDDFPIHRVPLSDANVRDAIIASGAIPMILQGVRDIAGAPPGMYRDGGVIDYHLDIPAAAGDRVALFPHFFGWLKPGWFDRRLSWRHHRPTSIDRVVLVSPSPEFVQGLPDSKVPDRTDFARMPESRRVRIWREVVTACTQLADELNDVLDRGQLPARLERL